MGDIGDVISIYERIIKAANGSYPVSPEMQSDCFQNHCSHRLYDLNRRGGSLKDVAQSFAEASYEQMAKSAREARAEGQTPRIRQYSSIYVRMTSGDTGKQMHQLRELIDAGVFVFTGRRPRTKTRDSDPILQFKLTFRRIYGLANHIGLAERDRFELSGSELEEWLSEPTRGKEILQRNLGGGLEDEAEESEADVSSATDETVVEAPMNDRAPTLFDSLDGMAVGSSGPYSPSEVSPDERISVEELTGAEAAALRPTSLVLGLGFEERTLESAKRLVGLLEPTRSYAVGYEEQGKSREIKRLLEKWGPADLTTIPYAEALPDGILVEENGTTLVDVTGLAKPIIFHTIRQSLRRTGSVLVAHTRAKHYYPTEKDMERLLKSERDRHKFFEALSGILTGEKGPYQRIPLLTADADETRRSLLVAFSSPKHERLLSLVESKVIDRLEVVAPAGDTARNRVARQIAEIAATDNASSKVTMIDSDDLRTTVDFLRKGFEDWYVRGGFNFEIGLTGSKMEAVAAAAISAFYKLTQCWYVRPQQFDPQRFTKGAGDTRFFRISSREPQDGAKAD
ncbi:hypothetical protein [Bradyrhizobium elkanii]|uniref:hypothetical protein n=1 Tax=Bradyrhizobium elkanii TaxID=29448 RepID=UPI0004B5E1D9|nr:hypothetical protein [Bradyrhizobium elkanii]WLA83230.1 hypothetical protein QNJ99_02485 [Bradyrhizobium elkanii]